MAVNVSKDDVEAIARMVASEVGGNVSGNKSDHIKAVTDTILNRVTAGFNAPTVQKGIDKKWAFTGITKAGGWRNWSPSRDGGLSKQEMQQIRDQVKSRLGEVFATQKTLPVLDFGNPEYTAKSGEATKKTKAAMADLASDPTSFSIGSPESGRRHVYGVRADTPFAAPSSVDVSMARGTLYPGMAADSTERYRAADNQALAGYFGDIPRTAGLIDAPPSMAPRTTATQPPSAIQQVASWLSNIAERASNETPIPPASVPKMQDRIAPEPWGGAIYSSNDPPLSSGMQRTPTGPGTMAAPVSPVTRSSLPDLVRPDEAFDDVGATRSPSFFYSRENAPKPIDPFSWDIGPGNNWAAAAPRLSEGGFPPLSQPVAGNPRQMDNTAGRPGAPSGSTPTSWIPASITQAPIPSGDRTTVNNISGSFALPSMAPMLSASQSAAGMMGRGIVNGLTSMGQAADNAATSWKHVLNPAYTAAQKSLAAARAQQSSGTMGAIGDPRRQDMTAGAPGVTPQAVSDAIAKAMQTLASTPQTIRVPSLPAPKEIRTLPQLTPAINAPSGGGGNNSGNPFAAAGMQQIGTAPSGAALWSNGNGQVFSGNAPSNLFGGMGFGGGGGSFRGVNNY
jgi:hypothetical protein